MVSFKLCVSDPSTGRTFQREVKDNLAMPFIGLNIGETIKGDLIDIGGYEFQITGGSDYCGFPMRKGILGLRKKITIYGGVGFRGGPKGIKKRKTVCGHKIYEKISQINLKVVQQGPKKLNEIFGVAEKGEKEVKPDTKKEGVKEERVKAKEEEEETKEHKTEHKAEHKKEEKAEVKEEKKEQEIKEQKKEQNVEEKKQ